MFLQTESNQQKPIHHELYANMNKFTTQLGNAIQQVHGDVHLPIPELPIQLTANNLTEASHVWFFILF